MTVVPSTVLWTEFCRRVQRRLSETAVDLEDAFEEECNLGGIEADYMDTAPGGTHFIVSSETLGNEDVSDEYVEDVAEILTEMGYPTRPILADEIYRNCDEGCGPLPSEILLAAMKLADAHTSDTEQSAI